MSKKKERRKKPQREKLKKMWNRIIQMNK